MRVMLDAGIPPADRAKIQAAAPGVEILTSDVTNMAEVLPTISAGIAWAPEPAAMRQAKQLRWIQTRGQGVEGMPFDLLRELGIVLTNGRGGGGPAVAETVIAHLFALSGGIPDCVDGKRDHRRVFDKWNTTKMELDGATLLQIGVGDIGSRVAAKASALGMYVIGLRRRPLPPPPGVMEMVWRDRLHEALARADYVAMALPLTPETIGFIGEPELKAMKKTAYLCNAGRGPAVQKEPLMRALKEGWIAGAGLDVTIPDPLPPSDPMWDAPNLMLTQHLGGSSVHINRRVAEIYAENLRRFVSGEPLMNVIDLVARY
jgi:phosphoglycerate dehydrogenase-like enzyme